MGTDGIHTTPSIQQRSTRTQDNVQNEKKRKDSMILITFHSSRFQFLTHTTRTTSIYKHRFCVFDIIVVVVVVVLHVSLSIRFAAFEAHTKANVNTLLCNVCTYKPLAYIASECSCYSFSLGRTVTQPVCSAVFVSAFRCMGAKTLLSIYIRISFPKCMF